MNCKGNTIGSCSFSDEDVNLVIRLKKLLNPQQVKCVQNHLLKCLNYGIYVFYFILIRDEFMNGDISTSHSPSVKDTTPPISLISSQNLVENSFLVFD